MASRPVANFEIQDVSIIVIFEASEFSSLSPAQQQDAHRANQQATVRQGWKGSVVTMWKCGGRKHFLCEPAQRPFFEAVRYDQLYAQRNRTIP